MQLSGAMLAFAASIQPGTEFKYGCHILQKQTSRMSAALFILIRITSSRMSCQKLQNISKTV